MATERKQVTEARTTFGGRTEDFIFSFTTTPRMLLNIRVRVEVRVSVRDMDTDRDRVRVRVRVGLGLGRARVRVRVRARAGFRVPMRVDVEKRENDELMELLFYSVGEEFAGLNDGVVDDDLVEAVHGRAQLLQVTLVELDPINIRDDGARTGERGRARERERAYARLARRFS